MSHTAAFRTSKGEAAYFAAYDAAMKLWPVSYEEAEVSSRFGTTHVAITGPKDAPPLVLLHGYRATSAMWSPNIADFSKDHRVYAIDVMGQPGRSIPDEPIRSAADYVTWLTATLDALHLDRISLMGMSFGGWLALAYTVAAPERVQQLVLLSPGGFLPIARKFSLLGMLMVFFPTHITVNSFMRWAGFSVDEPDARRVCDLMRLGMKHFRMPPETLRVAANPLSDDELREIHAPVLLLMGEHEVICDSATALARARRLIPDFQGGLIPGSGHDMYFSQHQIVDARILEFLKKTRADDRLAPRSTTRGGSMLVALFASLALAALYWFPVRRWFGRWGTTSEDLARFMTGDAVIVNPTHSTTHAITIDAPPEDIWPWLVQMGYQRGGLYSYDWLDRIFGILDHPSANRVLPEFQRLAVGDRILLGPGEELTVTALVPQRALVLGYRAHGFEWVWQFGLYPLDNNRTRLVSRGTERVPKTAIAWLFMRVMEPAAFIMTRRMLLGLKQRAEMLRASGAGDAGAGRRAAA